MYIETNSGIVNLALARRIYIEDLTDGDEDDKSVWVWADFGRPPKVVSSTEWNIVETKDNRICLLGPTTYSKAESFYKELRSKLVGDKQAGKKAAAKVERVLTPEDFFRLTAGQASDA